MDTILHHLEREFYMIEGAPVAFTFVCLLAWILIWWVMDKHIYGPRLKAANDLIELYKKKIELASASGSGGAPTEQVTSPMFSISREQYAEVVANLSRYTIPADQKVQRYVAVYVSVGVAENQRFALRMTDAISEAGWFTKYSGEINLEGCRSGIWIIGAAGSKASPPTEDVLRDALIAAGIPAHIDKATVAPSVWLVVGAKEA
jgi:hypothetical protein